MKTIIFICGWLMVTSFLQGQVIFIPNDYPSIQEGINSANPGDTIIVGDGIYYERINYLGKKPLTIASMFLLDGDESHIANTIIDGSQLPYPTQKSLVYFILGEDTTCTLCGFTLRNGCGTLSQTGDLSIRAGGAIYISNSGARIIYNHITQNHLNYNPLQNDVDIFSGGAISNEPIDNDHWVILEHNLIDFNSCTSGGTEASAGGVILWGNSRVAYNTITNNSVTGHLNSTAVAAGLACATDPAWNKTATAIVSHNTIAFNTAKADNNYAAYGGGLLQHVVGILESNDISDNLTETYTAYGGGVGGFGYWIPLEGSRVSGNSFLRNSSNMWSGALNIETTGDEIEDFSVLVEKNYFLDNHAKSGGAFTVFSVPVCLQNNVFSGNSANLQGGAILAWKDFNLVSQYMLVLVNNSFYGNSAIYGGAIHSIKAKPMVFNSIFSGNTATLGPEIYVPYPKDTVSISHSDIDFLKIYGRVTDLGGNIDADPLFDDEMLLTISPESPCIDIGTPNYTCNHGHKDHQCPPYDIDNVPRPMGGDFDIGAHEILFAGIGPVGSRESGVVSCYPNPLNRNTRVEYTLGEDAHVTLSVYNNVGQEVDVLVNGMQQKGHQKIEWNAEAFPAGIYFFRLSTLEDRQSVSGKLVIAR